MRRQSVQATSVLPDSATQRRSAELEQFLRANAQRLLGALTLITGNRATAEDALQEALVKAWHRRDEPIENLAAWITVVAMNHARSGRRRSQAEQRALQRAGARGLPTGAGVAEPDEALLAALRSLPQREREVAVLHYVLDQSVAQVAAAMGVTDGTVKTLLSRARTHLAERMEVEGGAA